MQNYIEGKQLYEALKADGCNLIVVLPLGLIVKFVWRDGSITYTYCVIV